MIKAEEIREIIKRQLQGYEAEIDLKEAGRVIEITTRARHDVTRDTLLVPGMTEAADVELLWPYVAVAQLYAFHQSRALGLSPDNPNKEGTVNRVVQGVRLYSLPQ